jgi:catechol 2,3-dioxygenase-like lactoylglutathione lyase family enzyme
MTTLNTGTVSFRICLDVGDLERSARFYAEILEFRETQRIRPGLLLESRLLASPRYPGIQVHLRAVIGKRVIGTQPGTVLYLGLADTRVDEVLARCPDSIVFIGPRPAPSPELKLIRILDPDGYEWKIFHPDLGAINP